MKREISIWLHKLSPLRRYRGVAKIANVSHVGLFEEVDCPAMQDPETLGKSRLRNESKIATLGEHS